jgi:hypothetical protein
MVLLFYCSGCLLLLAQTSTGSSANTNVDPIRMYDIYREKVMRAHIEFDKQPTEEEKEQALEQFFRDHQNAAHFLKLARRQDHFNYVEYMEELTALDMQRFQLAGKAEMFDYVETHKDFILGYTKNTYLELEVLANLIQVAAMEGDLDKGRSYLIQLQSHPEFMAHPEPHFNTRILHLSRMIEHTMDYYNYQEEIAVLYADFLNALKDADLLIGYTLGDNYLEAYEQAIQKAGIQPTPEYTTWHAQVHQDTGVESRRFNQLSQERKEAIEEYRMSFGLTFIQNMQELARKQVQN